MPRPLLIVLVLGLTATACATAAPAERTGADIVITAAPKLADVPRHEATREPWVTAAPNPQRVIVRPAPQRPLAGLQLTRIARGLREPVWIGAPRNDDRLFVVEKPGTVRIIEGGVVKRDPFLDITNLVKDDHLERGLTGMAFHPDFWRNGRVVTFFTDREGTSRVVEYRLAERNPERLDVTTGRTLLAIEQFHPAHQGGVVTFGPDGYLWVGIGDGGIAHDGRGGIESDPRGHGQNPATLFGTVVRIDVDSPTEASYAIPPDNPFAADPSGAAEVWSFGLRNPWRISFDAEHVYISDVGHERWEEVNVVPLAEPGANFGWSKAEGPECFEATSCNLEEQVDPLITVDHGRACAVVGGPVYEGTLIPELAGHFFYGDFCRGWVRSFKLSGTEAKEQTEWFLQMNPGSITSFGAGGDGEIYLLNLAGDVFRIEAIRAEDEAP